MNSIKTTLVRIIALKTTLQPLMTTLNIPILQKLDITLMSILKPPINGIRILA